MGGDHRVLIVDDEELQADGLAQLLRDEGFATEVALTAGDALASARSRPPRIVISDARLGDGDGVELLCQLRRELGRVTTVLLTGLPREEPSVAAAVRRHQVRYVAKPVDLSRLVTMLRVA